ncbi:Glyceraldehyde 3 phosphate dehydrogenase NAD binding domain [Trypanosoma vivax]|uniref:Putative glyceraldehyde-3-phosphate dehydrogenase n=1 Tax=Trypanosoma vivax (strain Y486) TaxID=1055687 RepID=G0U2V4_TRYVY|nr:putative glyceraldehyde-3-phosphate dehydrogenase [Trypanosoma vivax]KAH8604161.1 Glyceraldehyde 3 phosphate dehydrogenase NAD binding domain [Trypanosoma vivax]CCC50608.1 putative glyceraldehyde-3-phosphate dehydrogenase [Trypanosoma vivax Y486]
MAGAQENVELTSLPVSVGINGFGPLGRAILFASFAEPRLEVTAINDFSMGVDYIAYMIQSDSPLSPGEKATITVVGEFICIRGKEKIRVTQKHDLVDVAWRDAGVSYVVDCTGLNSTRERCWGHINAGARGVVIAGHSSDALTVVTGVNDTELKKVQPIICAGTPIAVALGPLIRLLHLHFGLEEATYTAVHNVRPAEPTAGRWQNLDDWRQTRATTDTILLCKQTDKMSFSKLMPALSERISGSVFQVPITRGCAIDMTLRFSHPVAKESLDCVLTQAAMGTLKDCLTVSKKDLVSRDVPPDGRLYYDVQSSQCLRDGELHKLLLWFELDGSYARRVLHLIPLMHKMSVGEGNT